MVHRGLTLSRKKREGRTVARKISDAIFERRMERIRKRAWKRLENDPLSGVVYISKIPHGFFELAMFRYFTQFGRIKRLRLSRSKKTGRSKGYAYIEFEFAEVAKVVASTMNNYLMCRKLLQCKFVPKEELHPETFKGCFRSFREPKGRFLTNQRTNNYKDANPLSVYRNLKRRAAKEGKKEKLMKEMGIDYKIDGYRNELECYQTKLEQLKQATSAQKRILEEKEKQGPEELSTEETTNSETDTSQDKEETEQVENTRPASARNTKKATKTEHSKTATPSRRRKVEDEPEEVEEANQMSARKTKEADETDKMEVLRKKTREAFLCRKNDNKHPSNNEEGGTTLKSESVGKLSSEEKGFVTPKGQTATKKRSKSTGKKGTAKRRSKTLSAKK